MGKFSKDVEEAKKMGIETELQHRLGLTSKKIRNLAKGISSSGFSRWRRSTIPRHNPLVPVGIRSIAQSADPIGEVTCRREITKGLILDKVKDAFASLPDRISKICLASSQFYFKP